VHTSDERTLCRPRCPAPPERRQPAPCGGMPTAPRGRLRADLNRDLWVTVGRRRRLRRRPLAVSRSSRCRGERHQASPQHPTPAMRNQPKQTELTESSGDLNGTTSHLDLWRQRWALPAASRSGTGPWSSCHLAWTSSAGGLWIQPRPPALRCRRVRRLVSSCPGRGCEKTSSGPDASHLGHAYTGNFQQERSCHGGLCGVD
jgi:hypothetical protein